MGLCLCIDPEESSTSSVQPGLLSTVCDPEVKSLSCVTVSQKTIVDTAAAPENVSEDQHQATDKVSVKCDPDSANLEVSTRSEPQSLSVAADDTEKVVAAAIDAEDARAPVFDQPPAQRAETSAGAVS